MRLLFKTSISYSLLTGFSTLYAANMPLGISGNLTFATDYLVRGITQTNEGPAIQGELDVIHENGVYAGVWGSSLNFSEAAIEDRAHVEVDYSVGYAQRLRTGTSYGVEWVYYTYPDANGEFNYDFHEVALNLGYEQASTAFGFTYAYSPESFGEGGQAHYFELKLGHKMAQGVGLNAYVGQQIYSDDEKGGEDYMNYGVSLSYSVQNFFDVSVNYADTDLDNVESSTFFEISKDF